jgi:hypothetical protein
MGREIREVPLNWNHPKDARGQYVPNHCYVLTAEMRAEYVDAEGNDDWRDSYAEVYLPEPWPADAVRARLSHRRLRHTKRLPIILSRMVTFGVTPGRVLRLTGSLSPAGHLA